MDRSDAIETPVEATSQGSIRKSWSTPVVVRVSVEETLTGGNSGDDGNGITTAS